MLNNQDFTQDRMKFIGGSDIGAILGLSRYRTPIDVWLEKTGEDKSKEANLAMRFGSFAEEFIAKEYAKATGQKLLNHPSATTHQEHDFFKAHIDRFILKKNTPKFDDDLSDIFPPQFANQINKNWVESLLECKTANPFSQSQWGDAGSDQVPLVYLCQCAWYLAITQMEQMDLAVLFGNQDFRIYTIRRDLELEHLILEKAYAFWECNVLQKQRPNVKNIQDCQKVFAKSVSNKKMEVSKATLSHLTQLPLLHQQALAIEKEIDLIKQAVMQEMQDAEVLLHEGLTIATWKAPKASLRIDTKRLQNDYPDLIKPYQAPIANTRRLVLKEIELQVQ